MMDTITATCARAFRSFVSTQVWLSRRFDRLLPKQFRIDGNTDFTQDFVNPYVQPATSIVDVGGGKQPLLSPERKRALGVRVVGLDVDAAELARAPQDAYDEVVCADITSFRGNQSAELVICQAVLEHVPNVSAALASLSTIVKAGGVALLFVPSKNAWYARLNRALPAAMKRWLLFSIFPQTEKDQGFPAYYDRCTPRELISIAAAHGLKVDKVRLYYTSSYFSCFFPLYLLWRLHMLALRAISPQSAAETFSLALRKERGNPSGAAVK